MGARAVAALALLLLAAPVTAMATAAAPPPPLKVFILVGQSNMVGHGYFEAKNKTTGAYLNGTLGYLASHPRTAAEYAKLIDPATGRWAHRQDVFVINDVNALGNASADPPPAAAVGVRSGNVGAFLSPGWGGESTSIGPELGFGWAVGDALAPQVLLLKVAWGGKTLGADFRPPSSGGTVGPYYTWMVKKVRKYLGDLAAFLPPSDAAGSSYELAGFVWHQGWCADLSGALLDCCPTVVRTHRCCAHTLRLRWRFWPQERRLRCQARERVRDEYAELHPRHPDRVRRPAAGPFQAEAPLHDRGLWDGRVHQPDQPAGRVCHPCPARRRERHALP